MGVGVGVGVGEGVGEGGITVAVGGSVAAGLTGTPKTCKPSRFEHASRSRLKTRKANSSRLFMAATITQAESRVNAFASVSYDFHKV
jgi:hypothetical protein